MRFLLHGARLKQTGYTVIELVVVISVIALITGIVMVGNPKYQSTIYLSNLAYDVALSLRQTQVYGINVRQSSTANCFGTTSSPYCAGYGVHFKNAAYTSGAEASTISFIQFIDLNNNRRYDGGSEFLGEYKITSSANIISGLCASYGGSFAGGNTTLGASCNAVGVLDVTFRRPDPAACITDGRVMDDGGGQGVQNSSYCVATLGIDTALITLRAEDGSQKRVKVYATGQISVQ